MRDEFLSEEDLDLRNLSWEELLAWWNEWLRAAQATNDADQHLYSHGVFQFEPQARENVRTRTSAVDSLAVHETSSAPLERIRLVQGDLTLQDVDAIVNAANESLRGGGGVDGAIHRAAGPELLEECKRLHPGGCPTGQVRLTGGHRLKARAVIHAVGPRYRDGRHGEAELLASCYREPIELAAREGLRTLAFPAISCGAYGYPWEQAAEVALAAIAAALTRHPEIDEVRIVLRERELLAVFERALERLASGENARR